MKNLLIFLGALTFVTQAHCKLNQCKPHDEFATFYNDSKHPVSLGFYDEKNNQYHSSILPPEEETVVNLSTLGQVSNTKEHVVGSEKTQLSYITITLEEKVNGNKNTPENMLKKKFIIKKNEFPGPIRITDALAKFLKQNK